MTTPPPTEPATKTAAKKAAAAPPPERHPEHESIADALTAFQAEMPKVAKNQTANIPGRDGRQGYRYTYADLGDLTSVAVPLLVKHGMAWTCLPRRVDGGQGYELVGVLLHGASDQRLEGALPLIGRGAQELGSSLTYNRRYLFGCMTGIVTDDDEDGSLAQQAQHVTQSQPDRVIDRRTTVDTRDPWATPETREQVMERLTGYAKMQQMDFDTLTARYRADRGDMTPEAFTQQPVEALVWFADSVGKWIDDRTKA